MWSYDKYVSYYDNLQFSIYKNSRIFVSLSRFRRPWKCRFFCYHPSILNTLKLVVCPLPSPLFIRVPTLSLSLSLSPGFSHPRIYCEKKGEKRERERERETERERSGARSSNSVRVILLQFSVRSERGRNRDRAVL